jgi:hypothetical protein
MVNAFTTRNGVTERSEAITHPEDYGTSASGGWSRRANTAALKGPCQANTKNRVLQARLSAAAGSAYRRRRKSPGGLPEIRPWTRRIVRHSYLHAILLADRLVNRAVHGAQLDLAGQL